ncbi:hypothetical protein [Duganella sp. Root336D2]|uniref:hypothetical protein n=1 Tax=Duganella sp. Root336D2 TaxID=1736518 RepID=UPI001E5B295F|nr:hypothetical protein [Duganella sp. Root336D2]
MASLSTALRGGMFKQAEELGQADAITIQRGLANVADIAFVFVRGWQVAGS